MFLYPIPRFRFIYGAELLLAAKYFMSQYYYLMEVGTISLRFSMYVHLYRYIIWETDILQ